MADILITGATGSVGGELAKIFSRENLPVVAAVSNPKIIGDFPRNVETRWFDITQAKTFAVALRDIRKIFLLRPPAVSNVRRDIFPFLKFCKNAEIEQIVLLSILGAQNAAYLPHRKIELEIQRLEIPYTFLRPSYFMQNFSTVHREEIKNRNEIYVPAGSGKTSFVDVRDVAEVAFKAFFDARMTNQSYELTGSKSLTYARAAEIFTKILQKPIRYVNPSVPAFFWRKFGEKRSLMLALVMSAIYTTARLGKAGRVTQEITQLLGREPISLEQFVEDYAVVWL